MSFAYNTPQYLLVIISAICSLVMLAGVFLYRKAVCANSKTSHLAAIMFFMEGLGMLIFVSNLISSQNGTFNKFEEILMPGPIVAGYTTFIFLLVYLFETKRPGWFISKKAIIFILPLAILSALVLSTENTHQQLYSLGDVVRNVRRPEVILRVLFIFSYFINALAAVCVPHSWRDCAVSNTVLTTLQALILLVSLTFIPSIGFNSLPGVLIHTCVIVALDILICHIEFSIKIPVRRKIRTGVAQKGNNENLAQFMDNPDIWMNPDMTILQLVKLTGVDQVELINRIKSMGYAGYGDFINRKRIDYICQELAEKNGDPDLDIVQLMFEVGFRSRTHATSEFKRIVGMTPTEYIRTLRNV